MKDWSEGPEVAILADFLDRLHDDRDANDIRSLADYQSFYPGYESAIADAFAELAVDIGAPSASDDDTKRQDRIDPANASQSRLTFGRYRLEKKLGSGGQGTVYLAKDTKLDRPVALKILHKADILSPSPSLQDEAVTAARPEHSYICPIYDIAVEHGISYLSMRYVPGETLRTRIEALRERGVPGLAPRYVSDVTILVERVARALHHAHEKGVVHRDIKPGNIMVQPDGNPIVLDFGLARDERAVSKTRTGDESPRGTLPYMAPEQFDPGTHPPDRRTDVFCLGAVLYEALTLERAFPGEVEFREGALPVRKLPPDPRGLNRAVGEDLAIVVETALANDPGERYPTALDFAEDLCAVRESRDIFRRAGLWRRLRRRVRRYLRVATIAAALILTVSIGTKVTLDLWDEASDSKAAERWAGYESRIKSAKTSLEQGDVLGAINLLESCDGEFRDIEWGRLRLMADTSLHRVLDGERPVRHLFRVAGPDGTRLVAGLDGGAFVLLDPDRKAQTIRLSAPSGRLLSAGPVGDRTWFTAFQVGNSVHVQMRDSSGGLRGDSDFLGSANAVAVAPDATRAAVIDGDGQLCSWDLESDRIQSGDAVSGRVSSIAFDPRGNCIAAVVGDHRRSAVEFLNTEPGTGSETWLVENTRLVRSVLFSADALRVLTVASALDSPSLDSPGADSLSVWDCVGRTRLASYPGALGRVTCTALHPHDHSVFVGSDDGTIRRIDAGLTTELEILRGHTGPVTAFAFDPSGGLLHSASEDGTVRSWDITRRPGRHGLRVAPEDLMERPTTSTVAFDPTGRYLASTMSFLLLDVWDLEGTGVHQRGVPANSVAFCIDSPCLLVHSAGELVRLNLESRDRETLVTYEVLRGVGPTLIDAAGRRVVFARGEGTSVHVHSWAQRSDSREFDGMERRATLLAMSGDGHWIAAVSAAPELRVWDLESERNYVVSVGSGRPVSLALSHDGRTVALGQGNVVRVYGGTRFNLVGKPLVHAEQVTSVTFAPSSRRIVVGTNDRTIHVWKVGGETPLMTFDDLDVTARVLAFSPAGDRLVVGGERGPPRVLNLRSSAVSTEPEPVERTATHVSIGRRLAQVERTRFAVGYIRVPFFDVVQAAFCPSEWYHWAAKATVASEHVRGLTNHGIALFRIGEYAEAEKVLSGANSLIATRFRAPVPKTIPALSMCRTLLGDRDSGRQILEQVRKPYAKSIMVSEARMLVEGDHAVAAYRVVDELFRSGTGRLAKTVLKELHARENLDEQTRRVAVRFATLRGDVPDMYGLLAYLVVTSAGESADLYRKAHDWAKLAHDAKPSDLSRVIHAGALYRIGEWQDALKQIAKVEDRSVIRQAFDCLSRLRIGNDEQAARRSYNRFVLLACGAAHRDNLEVRTLLAEAAALVDPR